MHDGDALVAVIIGRIDLHRDRLRGYIAMLAVETSYRKRGLGPCPPNASCPFWTLLTCTHAVGPDTSHREHARPAHRAQDEAARVSRGPSLLSPPHQPNAPPHSPAPYYLLAYS